uniref:Uncharacterized protein n=1 Tax=Haptolina brevifila TaxID=156173 RepID=A0A7S2IZB8_9EUKA
MLIGAQYVVLALLPDYPQDLAEERARHRWRHWATHTPLKHASPLMSDTELLARFGDDMGRDTIYNVDTLEVVLEGEASKSLVTSSSTRSDISPRVEENCTTAEVESAQSGERAQGGKKGAHMERSSTDEGGGSLADANGGGWEPNGSCRGVTSGREASGRESGGSPLYWTLARSTNSSNQHLAQQHQPPRPPHLSSQPCCDSAPACLPARPSTSSSSLKGPSCGAPSSGSSHAPLSGQPRQGGSPDAPGHSAPVTRQMESTAHTSPNGVATSSPEFSDAGPTVLPTPARLPPKAAHRLPQRSPTKSGTPPQAQKQELH